MISPLVSDFPYIAFSEQDLNLFRTASMDLNPLHRSHEYARRTPFGRPVVFGCLGALACLSRVELPQGHHVTRMQVDFPRPMFPDIPYSVEVSERSGGIRARLMDGSVPVVTLALKTAQQPAQFDGSSIPDVASTERGEAAQWTPEQLSPGSEVSGTYSGNVSARQALARFWNTDPFLTTVLCWSSYLVGMELPGESALFSTLTLNLQQPGNPQTLTFGASVKSVDQLFGLIRMNVFLNLGALCVASGECWAYARPELPAELPEVGESGAANNKSLAGCIAILTGASRGLGASLQLSLERRGALVYSISRSPAESLRTLSGDAADPEACRRLRLLVEAEHQRLDLLICNAFPAIPSLLLEPNCASRIAAYINQAVAMTLTPMCELLHNLNQSDGCLVLISSSAVEQPVKAWPHYIAAKQAVEMLARVAVLEYPRIRTLIVRPTKLLTALTNTPVGRADAIAPALLANRLATRLESSGEAGTVEVFT